MIVATYNVRHGLGRDDVLDFERCANLVRDVGPDVVALQELDRGMARSGGVDQPRLFAGVTSMQVAFFPTLERDGGHYGIALAARHLFTADFRFLPRLRDEEPRGVISAAIGGLSIRAVHLSRSRAARRIQIADLAASTRGDPRAVVAGDFNAPPRELETLAAAGARAVDAPPTMGRRRIDHIVLGPGLDAGRVWTVPSPASDHVLLAAEVLL